MACLEQPTEDEKRRALGPLVRNEVVRVLATQMFCYNHKSVLYSRGYEACSKVQVYEGYGIKGLRIHKS